MHLSPSEVFHFEPFPVEKGKVKEFAKALGLEIEHGTSIAVPPTFFTVIDYWNERDFYQMLEQFNIPSSEILHGEQSYEYKADVFVGDIISAKGRLLKSLRKNNKLFYFLETIYTNHMNIEVAIGRATLIELKVDSA
ncbi:N-terminal half of MaoC dehydratase [Psychrobacillus sp. OK028]|uniref:FAS1-like dehydratase domain-containing protein n=1 Tax=Psychrobacillus sp. OK028 TaxID=1884359 RepID=UPI000887D685|nr:MaoC family dehydratase N-terminal domain-containing protein [Psychrobacillus sp. OK028]SDM40327.1 N-terminal half of MaoC dehydratase [Psychrobacillus sp. OK028]